jgi:hypothetical protein
VASVPAGVELNCVAQGKMGTHWWGVHISHIVHKEVELVVEVEKWALFFSIFP